MNKLRALCERWKRIAESIDDGSHVTECSKRACDFRSRAAELEAILPDVDRLETENIQNHKDRSEYREELREMYKTAARLVAALRDVPDPEMNSFCSFCTGVGQLPLVEETVSGKNGPYKRYQFPHKDCWYAKVQAALALFNQPVAPKETK